ncbi:AbiH family protein [Rothia dentocariosa]|jgi:hypothetical protein|uniref:AbiH family protein n=1 Tax=Rothia dentocariosa TaxID=2047 RepID=UPI003A8B5045
MGNRKYIEEFRKLLIDEQQHNIMALVGNGFDIQVLNFFESTHKTSYYDFYNFLVWQKIDDSNILFNQMKNMKNKYEEDPEINHNLQNWSDFESGIISIFNDRWVSYSGLEESLEELRSYFSIFLNEVVTPEVNNDLGKQAQENNLANNTFQMFLGDLSDNDIVKCEFSKKTDHYNLYNWQIFNFNFTSLLDNYMYLDRKQFNPVPHLTVDTNYYFYPNPRSVDGGRGNGGTIWSSYVISNVVHPHGYQNIPKSMLFGINSQEQIYSAGSRRLNSFIKPYWAQNDLKYAHLFEDTDLYIIFGMSLGITDQWWWRKIVDSLETSDSELILYNYCRSASEVLQETVKEQFMKASGWMGEDAKKGHIMDKIYVVNFDNSTPRFAFSMTPYSEA